MSEQLWVQDGLPDGLLDQPAHGLWRVLPGPSLLRLPGPADKAPLLVSVLLHGNEPGGWEAMRRLLAAGGAWPRPVWLLVGNVAAARAGVRHLVQQPDYNRIWGADGPGLPWADQLLDLLRATPPWAAVDVHNNTGSNPHYSCITAASPALLGMAGLFSSTTVLVERPANILIRALAPICPALVLEAGQPDEAAGVDHVEQFLAALLACPDLPGPSADLALFHTLVSVAIQPSVDFTFAGLSGPWPANSSAALVLEPRFEQCNFVPQPAGAAFARVAPGSGAAPGDLLQVRDIAGQDVAEQWFERRGDSIHLARPAVPSMFTLDPTAIRQDVLCYLMERLPP